MKQIVGESLISADDFAPQFKDARAFALSPDSRFLVTDNLTDQVWMWSVDNGRLQHTFPGSILWLPGSNEKATTTPQVYFLHLVICCEPLAQPGSEHCGIQKQAN